jgi:O-acetyl-ADP-ribose deacetylase (regulator of RNase III)
MTNLRVVVGDAAALTGVPALVLPANRQLTLRWRSHLAETVRRLAGPEVETEALAAQPGGVGLGEAVLTRAGRLANFTHLVHAAVLDRYDFNPLFLLRLRERTSEATLRAATRASLRLVHAAGLSGLVFTPMGAGIGGMRMSKCARLMVEETRLVLARLPGTPLRDVVFAVLKERHADEFRRAIVA